MKIDSQFLGKLRHLAGGNGEAVTLEEGSTLIGLTEKLSEDHGDSFSIRKIRENSYVILINGVHYETLDAERTVLKDGDTVIFMPVTMGG